MRNLWFIIPLILLTGCKSPSDKDKALQVAVLRGPSAIAFAEWMSQDSPKIDGQTINVQILDSPEQMQAALIKGEADIAALPLISAVNLQHKSIPYETLGYPIWGTLYIVGKDSLSSQQTINLFGSGTTPDILTQYFLRKKHLNCELNRTLPTSNAIMISILAGKTQTAVLSEPYVSMLLKKDTTFRIIADLNNQPFGFPQTTVLCKKQLYSHRANIESLLRKSCLFANEQPKAAIQLLENRGVFKSGMLTPEGIDRSMIYFKTTLEASSDVEQFLEIVRQINPEAIGEHIQKQSEAIHITMTILTTVLRGLIGICLSLLLAILFAWPMSRNKLFNRLMSPFLSLIRSIPIAAFILIALIFLNPDGIPLTIAFITMFPLLTENIAKGLINLNPELDEIARAFCLSKRNRLTQIIYPQLRPFLFSGLSSAMGFGWRAIIIGEVMSQCAYGIGSEMKRAQLLIDIPQLLIWAAAIVLISWLFDRLINWLSGCYFPVHYSKNIQKPTTNFTDIELNDISFNFPGKEIFSHLNYLFHIGRIYSLEAPSGIGKTTLLRLISGRLKPQSGSINHKCNPGIAIVPENQSLLNHLSAIENVALSIAAFTRKKDALKESLLLLSALELSDLGNQHPYELSFGQQQRIAIARALIYPSYLMLMDEPFKGLDEKLCVNTIAFIQKHHAEKSPMQTIIFTSHNQTEIKALADISLILEGKNCLEREL